MVVAVGLVTDGEGGESGNRDETATAIRDASAVLLPH